MPLEAKPLVKDENGEPSSGMFRYNRGIEMPLYLSGYTRPDISLSINSCARYMFIPKHSH